MKKIICLCLSLMMVLVCTVVASAEDASPIEGEATICVVDENGNARKYTFSLEELVSVQYDADGNVVPDSRLSLSKHSIAQGNIRYYYTSSGTHFKVSANSTVTFSVTLNSSAHVEMGYALKNQSRKSVYNGTSKTPSFTTVLREEGEYCFYLMNYSADTITVNSGSITL
ncbi:hypothetical protein [Gemmiger sp. An194]|uniref:hypothetical protein n=1 Tax=Gemmiger sp. An194 TaxID=1965582 RepID=UPI00117AD7F1|nr:hypothetical protein [Gemmiger sp. An194]